MLLQCWATLAASVLSAVHAFNVRLTCSEIVPQSNLLQQAGHSSSLQQPQPGWLGLRQGLSSSLSSPAQPQLGAQLL